MGSNSPNPPAAQTFRCPRCGNTDVVSSLPRHFWDELMRGFGRVPKHCRRCDKRFYVVDRSFRAKV